MAYKSINPFNNKVLGEYDFATQDQLDLALEAANDSFKDMKKQDIEARGKILQNVSKVLIKHEDELAETCTMEMGKLIIESRGEVELCALIADWFSKHSKELLKPDSIDTIAPGKAKVYKRALGALMMVEPWNFPYYQIMRVFAPNFMVGNSMILKHASNTPASAELFINIMREAGVPEGALTNMFLTYDQVTKAIESPIVQGVALTGSMRGGSSVASVAGKNVKKSTMELGGTDPFIVLSDANLDDVKSIAGRSRLYGAGQVCASPKRFIVMDNVYDDFIDGLISSFSKVKPGDPLNPKTTLAPLHSEKAKEKLQQQVNEAIEHGAKVIYGNKEIDLPGQFFMPTILTNISKDNPAYDTEFFGPVAEVYKVHSEQEAIDLANDSSYGLGGVVFSGNEDHGAEVAAKLETGMVFVNNGLTTLPELPFGGVKGSGYGRELSKLGQLAFVNEQLIVKSEKPDLDNPASALLGPNPDEK